MSGLPARVRGKAVIARETSHEDHLRRNIDCRLSDRPVWERRCVSGSSGAHAAVVDAQHVALATIADVDYLLTWNCKHIANATVLPAVYDTLRAEGYTPPLIVTPQEFSNEGFPDV